MHFTFQDSRLLAHATPDELSHYGYSFHLYQMQTSLILDKNFIYCNIYFFFFVEAFVVVVDDIS